MKAAWYEKQGAAPDVVTIGESERVNKVHCGPIGNAEATFIMLYLGVKEIPLSKGT
jgi:hypothetical protein